MEAKRGSRLNFAAGSCALAAVLLSAAFSALAQEIPAQALNCAMQAPPAFAARGIRSLHKLPMRLYPVAPGEKYTGCQWLWGAWVRPEVWDYAAVTYFEHGEPKVQRIVYPPLPVQIAIETCVHQRSGEVRKAILAGSDWQIPCDSAAKLRRRLVAAPGENGSWEAF